MQTGIDECDVPVFHIAAVLSYLTLATGSGAAREIVGRGFVVVQKLLTCEVAAEDQSQHEILVAIAGVVAH